MQWTLCTMHYAVCTRASCFLWLSLRPSLEHLPTRISPISGNHFSAAIKFKYILNLSIKLNLMQYANSFCLLHGPPHANVSIQFHRNCESLGHLQTTTIGYDKIKKYIVAHAIWHISTLLAYDTANADNIIYFIDWNDLRICRRKNHFSARFPLETGRWVAGTIQN